MRKELEGRKNHGKSERKDWSEDEIKEKIEAWINETNKKAELEEKLKRAFKNNNSHTKTPSIIT